MPQAQYEIRVYSPQTGLQTGSIITWNAFNLVRTLNSFDTLTLSLSEADPNVALFELDAILEVRRRIARTGADWYTETVLMHRTPEHALLENGRQVFISYSRGLNDLLHRREILYPANTAYTLKSGPSETVMKQLVDENAGPNSNNAARRDSWDPRILGLTIAANQARGNTWAGAVTWKNLLDALNAISLSAGMDFSIERVDPRAFEFRTYYPQFGVDRTAEILFKPEFDNMTNIHYTKSRTEEANAVAVLGQGQNDARITYPSIDNEAAAASPWNLIEFTRDARNEPSLTEMQSTAQEALRELSAQDNFTFKVLQTTARQYGKDAEYWFGDLIKASYFGATFTRKIVGVTFDVAQGRENIDFSFSAYPATQGA